MNKFNFPIITGHYHGKRNSGKTYFLINTAINYLRSGKDVIFVTDKETMIKLRKLVEKKREEKWGKLTLVKSGKIIKGHNVECLLVDEIQEIDKEILHNCYLPTITKTKGDFYYTENIGGDKNG